MDIFTKKKRSEIMSRVRSKNSLMERSLMRELARERIRHRKNVRELPGTPDIAFPEKRLVVFLDSCFWHGCRIHGSMPASNRAFWRKKLHGNKQRDRRINREYKKMGWSCLRFWEHQVKKDKNKVLLRIKKELRSVVKLRD